MNHAPAHRGWTLAAFLAAFAAISFVGGTGHAQRGAPTPATPQTGTGLVVGRVIDGATNRPIQGALVVMGPNAGLPANMPPVFPETCSRQSTTTT
jgi:hypothetical protein